MSLPQNPAPQPKPARRPSRERFVALALACLVVTAVLVVSFLPVQDKYFLHTKGRFHSSGHLVAFIVVAFVAGRVARSLRATILIFLGALLFGFALEFGEHVLFLNGMEWKDVLVDSLGVLCGTFLAIAASGNNRNR